MLHRQKSVCASGLEGAQGKPSPPASRDEPPFRDAGSQLELEIMYYNVVPPVQILS
jgi:hypothetical protein